MIKPDKEAIQRMIERFEQEITTARGCINVLQMEIWKLDGVISTKNEEKKL